MIDTDRYEGCQDHALTLHKGLLCPTILMDVDGSGKIVPTLDRGIADVQADIPEHYLHLLRDAPLLLEEVKRLREGILNVMAGIYDSMYDMNQALDRVILNG